VLVVGGGVTGTALTHCLSNYTNIERIMCIEAKTDFAMVNSRATNNSQTIHCGDIETNYTLAKAASVRKQADMLRNWATKLPEEERKDIIYKIQKMAIGVGDREVGEIKQRYEEFKHTFPELQLLDKQNVGVVEPKVVEGREEDVVGMFSGDEWTTCNYGNLSKAFAQHAVANQDRQVTMLTETQLLSAKVQDDGSKYITTNNGDIHCKYLVVSACGYSILIAHRMGYGKEFSVMPGAGSFYFVPGNFLNGKVYTCQIPGLPWAAVHGDPDVYSHGKTRFGPTAFFPPVLERYTGLATTPDYLEVAQIDWDFVETLWDMFKKSDMRNYALKNMLCEVPRLNKHIFIHEARKIIPTLKMDELTFADGYGGVRPCLIDRKNHKLLLGEGKINTDDGIIFNITPSPGATTCLGTAELDMKVICKHLGATIDEGRLALELHEGIYPTDPNVVPILDMEFRTLLGGFGVADKNGDEILSMEELKEFMSSNHGIDTVRKLGLDRNEVPMPKELFKVLDTDGNGGISYDEFVRGMHKLKSDAHRWQGHV